MNPETPPPPTDDPAPPTRRTPVIGTETTGTIPVHLLFRTEPGDPPGLSSLPSPVDEGPPTEAMPPLRREASPVWADGERPGGRGSRSADGGCPEAARRPAASPSWADAQPSSGPGAGSAPGSVPAGTGPGGGCAEDGVADGRVAVGAWGGAAGSAGQAVGAPGSAGVAMESASGGYAADRPGAGAVGGSTGFADPGGGPGEPGAGSGFAPCPPSASDSARQAAGAPGQVGADRRGAAGPADGAGSSAGFAPRPPAATGSAGQVGAPGQDTDSRPTAGQTDAESTSGGYSAGRAGQSRAAERPELGAAGSSTSFIDPGVGQEEPSWNPPPPTGFATVDAGSASGGHSADGTDDRRGTAGPATGESGPARTAGGSGGSPAERATFGRAPGAVGPIDASGGLADPGSGPAAASRPGAAGPVAADESGSAGMFVGSAGPAADHTTSGRAPNAVGPIDPGVGQADPGSGPGAASRRGATGSAGGADDPRMAPQESGTGLGFAPAPPAATGSAGQEVVAGAVAGSLGSGYPAVGMSDSRTGSGSVAADESGFDRAVVGSGPVADRSTGATAETHRSGDSGVGLAESGTASGSARVVVGSAGPVADPSAGARVETDRSGDSGVGLAESGTASGSARVVVGSAGPVADPSAGATVGAHRSGNPGGGVADSGTALGFTHPLAAAGPVSGLASRPGEGGATGFTDAGAGLADPSAGSGPAPVPTAGGASRSNGSGSPAADGHHPNGSAGPTSAVNPGAAPAPAAAEHRSNGSAGPTSGETSGAASAPASSANRLNGSTGPAPAPNPAPVPARWDSSAATPSHVKRVPGSPHSPTPPTAQPPVGATRLTGIAATHPGARRLPAKAAGARPAPSADPGLAERPGPVLPGWAAAVVGGVALVACAAVLWWAGAVPEALTGMLRLPARAYHGIHIGQWALLAFGTIVALFALGGLGRGRVGYALVLTLFGEYRGSVRRAGLLWISPLLLRRRVDVRLRHWRSEALPAVDAKGTALRVVVLVVWRVRDTVRAALGVEAHEDYLREQVEAAMARVLSQLPADAFHEDAPTLRDAEAVGEALTRMLSAECVPVGIEVFSAQPTRIEYAPEIAAAMQRRRIAAIDAKHRDSVLTSVVDAVDDMVHRLTTRGLVELDDYERKALVKDLTVAFYTGRGTPAETP